jgi:hypothetical protein
MHDDRMMLSESFNKRQTPQSVGMSRVPTPQAINDQPPPLFTTLEAKPLLLVYVYR